MLKKIQADMRSELQNDTKCASVVTEQNQESVCLKCAPSDAVLKSAKKNVTIYQSKLQNLMYMFNKICICIHMFAFLISKILSSK